MNIETQIEHGLLALREGAWEEARASFEATLAETDLPEASYGLANALWWLGEMQGTIEHYARAYAGFRQRPDPAHAAGVALLLSFHSCTHLANRALAEGWLNRAVRLIEEHDLEELRGELALFRGCLEEDAAQAEECARRAVDRSHARGDRDLELCALSLLGYALVEQGRVEEGMLLLDESMAASLGGEPERLDTVAFTSCRMMVSCTRCALFERAVEWVRASERFADRYGCPFLFAECRLVYGLVLFQTGRWEEAERELLVAIELARDSVPAYFADATASLASLRVAQGQLEHAEQLLVGVESLEAAVPVMCRLHLLHDRPELASAEARRRLDADQSLRLARVELAEILAEAEMALGDADAAADRGQRLAREGAERGCRVAVARGERLVGRALVLRDPDAARKHLDRALLEFSRLDMPYEAGLTRLALADALATCQSELAVSEAQLALETFEGLGADRCADEAAAMLRSLGVRVVRSGPRTHGDITPREEEVLALLGEGLSNPEIASRLFISRKTVEHHVSKLLAKLRLRNRAEAAAEAIRRGVTASASE
jgi:DNA-binding CsgD family transcriptional regulator